VHETGSAWSHAPFFLFASLSRCPRTLAELSSLSPSTKDKTFKPKKRVPKHQSELQVSSGRTFFFPLSRLGARADTVGGR
jgi:hypothetical protein